MKFILLTQGKRAVVDDEDFERVSQYMWHADKSNPVKRKKTIYYATCTQKKMGKNVKLHRFILDAPDNIQVDHINGDTLDCQKSNLRLATSRQNSWNSKRDSKYGFKGVSYLYCYKNNKQYVRRKPWLARIRMGEGKVLRKYFKTKEEAAKAYDVMAIELHGEFARLNFPVDTAIQKES